MRFRGGIERSDPTKVSDQDFVAAVVDVVELAQDGIRVSPAVESLLHAIAITRTEQRRHELAEQARVRAEQNVGTLSAVSLQLLRVAIFALA